MQSSNLEITDDPNGGGGSGGTSGGTSGSSSTGELGTVEGPDFGYNVYGPVIESGLGWPVTTGQRVYQDMVAQYDALGRMTYWEQRGPEDWQNKPTAEQQRIENQYGTPDAYKHIRYDAVGNVRFVDAAYEKLGGDGNSNWYVDGEDGAKTRGYFYETEEFRFDGMNRMVHADGAYIEYDAAGNRSLVADEGHTERFEYDAMNRLTRAYERVTTYTGGGGGRAMSR
jgi:hypothetical protein